MLRLIAFLFALAALMGAGVARADSQDIAAAARSVVRVALVTSDGQNAYFVGHGSGVVVAPDLVLTNAHVVELTRQEGNILIGVIPPEGKQSYGARVIAYSPGNDLALLRVEKARLIPATFFAGVVTDGQQVMAIGYPGAVDRAQGLSLADLIQPMSPVKTGGAISGGRAAKTFDTILHTAPLAQGNSGGPLVDQCGRVLGINSFGSLSDGSDAEFGFAVSNREIAGFLRQAGVQPLRTAAPCKSLADLAAAEDRANAQAQVRREAQTAAAADARRDTEARARDHAERQVIAGRENAMAIAALLLALAVLAAGGAGLAWHQERRALAIRVGIGGGVLFLGALIAFLLRPGFDRIDDAVAEAMRARTTSASIDPAATDGRYLCRFDEARSRVTISDTRDLTLGWRGGCLNGRTQMVRGADGWSRILTPADQANVAIHSFDPAEGRYRSDQYLIDSDLVDRLRGLRARGSLNSCTTDDARLAALATLQDEIRALLPPQPNERLVYSCAREGVAPR
jgi:hypothetical protein